MLIGPRSVSYPNACGCAGSSKGWHSMALAAWSSLRSAAWGRVCPCALIGRRGRSQWLIAVGGHRDNDSRSYLGPSSVADQGSIRGSVSEWHATVCRNFAPESRPSLLHKRGCRPSPAGFCPSPRGGGWPRPCRPGPKRVCTPRDLIPV